MIGFEGRSREECQAYNLAIKSVLKKAGFNPFHQIGDSQHEPGYHAWEIWKKATKEDLKILLPDIEEAAQRILSE